MAQVSESEILMCQYPKTLPCGLEEAAEEAAAENDFWDGDIQGRAAVTKIKEQFGCSEHVALNALQIAGAYAQQKQKQLDLSPAVVSRAMAWMRTVMSPLNNLQSRVLTESSETVNIKVPTDEINLRAIHRMRNPAVEEDYVLQSDSPHYLQPLNCEVASCDNDCCRDRCCTQIGLSVNFPSKIRQFYKAHLFLYKTVLRRLIELALALERAEAVPSSEASQQRNQQFELDGQFNSDAAINYLKEHDMFRLPDCAMRQSVPEGMRIFVSDKSKERSHGFLQPLPREDGKSFSLLALNAVGMAIGEGWSNCPFFLRAMAEPSEIDSSDLPDAPIGLARAMSRTLSRLLTQYVYRWATEPNFVNPSSLLTLAVYVVTLNETPEELLDLDAPRTRVQVEPSLAQLLFEALKLGFVDLIKPTGEAIVYGIANGLGLDFSEVYHADSCVEPAVSDTDRVCTTILYGNVVPFAVAYGQNPEQQQYSDVDDAAECYSLAELSSDTSSNGETGTDWDRRISALKEGSIIVKTGTTFHNLPFKDTVSQRMFREQSLPRLHEEVRLDEIGRLLQQQDAASIDSFMLTCIDNPQKALAELGEPGRSDMRSVAHYEKAARILCSQGNAVVAGIAGSVVAVVKSDPMKRDGFAEVSELLLKDSVVANFVTMYMSCRLLLQVADTSLPLATRTLMVFSTANPDADDDVFDNMAGRVQPPMPHFAAYLTVFDLNRPDIGHMMGVALALQLKEGISIARDVLELHSSFMIWFIDHKYPFDFADAIYRLNGCLSKDDAVQWADSVLRIGKRNLLNKDCGLERQPKSSSVCSTNERTKRLILLSWNDRLHKHGVQLVTQMLENSGSTNGSKICCHVKMTGLDTSKPKLVSNWI